MATYTFNNIDEMRSAKLNDDITQLVILSYGSAPFFPVTRQDLPNLQKSRVCTDISGALWVQSKSYSGGGAGGATDLTPIYDALNTKVDKVDGFGLSQNNFSDEYRAKLGGYQLVAQNSVQAIPNTKIALDLSDKVDGKEIIIVDSNFNNGDTLHVLVLGDAALNTLSGHITVQGGTWFGQATATTLTLYIGQSVTIEKIRDFYTITQSSGEYTLSV